MDQDHASDYCYGALRWFNWTYTSHKMDAASIHSRLNTFSGGVLSHNVVTMMQQLIPGIRSQFTSKQSASLYQSNVLDAVLLDQHNSVQHQPVLQWLQHPWTEHPCSQHLCVQLLMPFIAPQLAALSHC